MVSAHSPRIAPRSLRSVAALALLALPLFVPAACGNAQVATNPGASRSGSPSSSPRAAPSQSAVASSPRASRSPGVVQPSAGPKLAPLQTTALGRDSVLLRSPGTVRFRFRFVGPAPAAWNWRVIGFYGDVMASGVEVSTGGSSGSVSWDCRDRRGGMAGPGQYLVKIGPGRRYGPVMTTVGWVRFQPPVTARVYRRLPAAGRRVALTFDDGGSRTAWYWILRELTAARAKGTFFAIGKYVDGYAAREAGLTIADHMAIGSHTWSHPDLTTLPDTEIRSQLLHGEQAWWRGLRTSTVPYLRPPDGDYDARVLAVAGRLGYARIVMWDIDAGDLFKPRLSAPAIARNVLRQVRPGSIILMHIRGRTPKALPLIIAGLRARHYQMVTIPELFRAAGMD